MVNKVDTVILHNVSNTPYIVKSYDNNNVYLVPQNELEVQRVVAQSLITAYGKSVFVMAEKPVKNELGEKKEEASNTEPNNTNSIAKNDPKFEELKLKAKELGVKSVHLFSTKEKLTEAMARHEAINAGA